MHVPVATGELDVRQLLAALNAFSRGDFSVRLPDGWTGVAGKVADAFNQTIDTSDRMAAELERVSRAVGKEGKVNQRAALGDVRGSWAASVQCVNALITDLVHPTTETARVIGAVAKGDLSQTMALELDGRPLAGEFLRTARIVNTMVDQLGAFAAEVTRVAREVGTEGKLGGQARVRGVAGTWKDLTDSVNLMASNLTVQVRSIAAVTTAIAKGDLSRKITVDVKGEILELKDTINTTVDQLRAFASEVTRVAREVGTEGKLGGQAAVPGVAGTWKDLTDNVNFMASNLTSQVRNIAEVTKAVATGDLSRKITVDVKGEILELKNTVNTMVDQLSSFASEVTRVAREVGTEGRLGGQADVKGVAGTWKDLTDSVNFMASNLTSQVRNIAAVTTAVAGGDLSKKISVDVRGEILELKDTINTMVDQLRAFASEVTRVAREVGTEGRLGGQAAVPGVAGTWKDLTDSVNFMASNLTSQVRNIADVTKAVAAGDLSRKITVDVKGEILELKDTVNTMVDQLRAFASEVTRVAREVGSEGKLGGQAVVPGVAGTWKDLTDNVNSMASNLTSQVRGIAQVVTAVANGNLRRKLSLEAKGEIAALSETINNMIDTLATFADQVTTVAREVGVQGKLGGQAAVPGAAGTWKDLTDNVNQLAANLTTQVRAIAEVATAVTEGDLTRSIQVQVQGELEELKNNINEMIRNLKETTLKNSEQDWLKGNLARFTRMLQGQRDLLTVGRMILSELAPLVGAKHGVFYTMTESGGTPRLLLLASYAHQVRKTVGNEFLLGEGLVGQAAHEKERILLTQVPAEYVQISSGLGEAPPYNIVVLPVLFEGQVKAVMELASFERFSPTHLTFLDQLTESIGIVHHTIEANTRTDDLLRQSQSLAGELQSRQKELQQTNEQLEEKARLLVVQNMEVERKNQEVEQARQALEEKAAQLALTSKYKSEFLANMSHELRTPLNSLLILADRLAENVQGNLTPRQVEFAQTILASGRDLLGLINDILDLSKIESGTVTVEPGEVHFVDLADALDRSFRHVAEVKGLQFRIQIDPELPREFSSDGKRLQQVLKNLLANAFKFTEKGGVELRARRAEGGFRPDHAQLRRARAVLAFSVSDTGIGIEPDKQRLIFEAFQQADGGTSRRYGGTGLGLAISRELSRLLGGELRLDSAPGRGSVFTLYLPLEPVDAVPALRPAMEAPPLPAPVAAAAPPDDRALLRPDDRVLLVVEDDPAFAQVLAELGRERGFKVVVATRGADALATAREVRPDAITFDVGLPDVDGWRLLDRLKEDPETRHIPVFLVSAADDPERSLGRGAVGFVSKPADPKELGAVLSRLREIVEKTVKNLIVLDPDPRGQTEILELVGSTDVDVKAVGTPAEALQALSERPFDCLVVSLRANEAAALEALRQLTKRSDLRGLPVVVYGSGEGSTSLEADLAKLGQALVLRHARSPERLLDETALLLHRDAARLPADQQAMVRRLHSSAEVLSGRTVLIVDDDVRNIFALTSLLERHGMQVISAENGREALERLQHSPAIDVILMDIMLPGMDGYETTRAIRRLPQHRSLPILALTAKAMKGDREKCLEAGASDYIAKPVEADHLVAQLRRWLHRQVASMSVEIPPRPSVNVLLVDDRADKLLALESILADGDHRIVTAHSGTEALRALLRDEFAVILLDVNMPQLDGFQTATLIRGRPRSEKTPIIFMTAVNDLESGTSRGYSLGAVDYIHLPVAPEVLRAKVSVFVDLYRKREQIRQQAESERRSQEREHARHLAEAADRVEFETRRNRFFTLAPDMLGVAGFDGRLRQLNASWERTLGLTAHELCERPVFDFLHPEDRQGMRDHLRDLSEGAPTARFENRHRHGDGSYRWLSWTAAPFREAGLVYLFVRDITFRKVAEEERLQLVREQEARLAAERENEIKDQFLATLSHELRSPLTPILGWTSMLRSGQLAPPDAARALDVIERNARLQAQLIEDLLDVTRIVSGKLRMDLRPVDLRVVVEAGLDAVRTAALKRRIALAVELGPEPVRVVGDPERLQQVVWNLASNAVKFSNDGGSVRVNLDVETDTARLRVCDDGVGISAEFLPHVFDRFRQATAGSTRTHGGLGLGLTIVRHIVRAHGGTVEAASEGVGRGASFTVVLPRACGDGPGASVPASTAAARGEPEAEGSALAGRVVLVVDDEADVRDVLRLVLERHGARVVTAGSVEEALASVEAESPDLVVSDIGMPGADGYALLDHLRARASKGRPEVVALTAYASPEDAARALAAGFRAHLAKPVDPRVVVDTLAGLLRGTTREGEGGQG